MITIVGVGALGSHVAQFLRHYELRVIDFDKVESKNTLSQFHIKASVGKSKALSLSQTFNMLFGIKVSSIVHKLVEDNANVMLLNSELVIDCLDNAAGRKVIQNWARSRQVPCLHGALAANGQMGRIIWDEEFFIDGEVEGAATCEDGQHLPFIAMTSAAIARSAQEFLTSGKKISFQTFPISGVKSL